MKNYIYIVIFMLMTFTCHASEISLKNIESYQHMLTYVLQHSKDSSLKQNIYKYQLNEFLFSNNVPEALQLLNSIMPTYPSLARNLYSDFFVQYYQNHSYEKTWLHIQVLNSKLQSSILSDCIDVSLQQSDIDAANFFLNKIENQIIFSRKASKIVLFLASKNNVEPILSLIKSIHLPTEKSHAMQSLSLLYARQKKYKEANKWLDSLSNEKIYFETILKINKIAIDSGDLQISLGYYSRVKDTAYFDSFLLELISAQIKNNKIALAVDYASSLQKESYINDSFILIGAAFAAKGDFNRVDKIIEQLSPNTPFYYTFIEAISISFATHGHIEQSLKYSQQLPLSQQYKLLPALSYEFGKKKDYHFNLLIIQKIKDTSSLNQSLANFALGLGESKHHSKALHVIKMIKNKTVQQTALLKILYLPMTLEETQAYCKELNSFSKSQFVSYLSETDAATTAPDSILTIINTSYLTKSLHKKDAFSIFTIIASLHSKIGHNKDAKKLLKKANSYVKKSLHPISDIILKEYISTQVNLGNYKAAWKVILTHPNPKKALFFIKLIPEATNKKEENLQKKSLRSFAKKIK
ncbi:hypothetical protein OAJ27_00945 [bacterium]|nr:hypothetical protein [bacterium]